MSKLDDIQPTGSHGLYKVEIQVEGEWVSMALMSNQSILELTGLMDNLSDSDVEETL